MWGQGTVMESLSIREGLQIVEVLMKNGEYAKAVHYTDEWRLLEKGDEVQLNVAAEELHLGSGGFHLVAAILNSSISDVRSSPNTSTKGHIMKLKYTPLQRRVLSVEEEDSPYHLHFNSHSTLEGMPVLLGELHSMLPVAMSWIKYQNLISGIEQKIAYVMTDGGALPLVWSQHVALLEQLGWLAATITYGQAYGGKMEAVNKFSALLAAKHAAGAHLCIVTMGPGIVGTDTRYGYSGIEVGELVNAVRALGGIPIVIPRISFRDQRKRHIGLSHHTQTALQVAAKCPAVVPLPMLEDDENAILNVQVESLRQHQIITMPPISIDEIAAAFSFYPNAITSMGRGLFADPAFFQAICSAADWARQVHNPPT
ncbi:DUF3866 family protein [Paenibacillus sp. N3.4]|uniref:DUF3866 family protein n=1 Tax=Paenibacillus sp. N3.4 TaxID=2603222 RepID=UPI0011C7A565|nr:DUF3866 family protein [Paenibacillus sp. N3.4]TXK83490.1 DUF3866 family protein [Paenibacillus sp. N3.4]